VACRSPVAPGPRGGGCSLHASSSTPTARRYPASGEREHGKTCRSAPSASWLPGAGEHRVRHRCAALYQAATSSSPHLRRPCTPSSSRWASSPGHHAVQLPGDGCPMWNVCNAARCGATRSCSTGRKGPVRRAACCATFCASRAAERRFNVVHVRTARPSAGSFAHPTLQALSFVGSTRRSPWPSTRACTRARRKRFRRWVRSQNAHGGTPGTPTSTRPPTPPSRPATVSAGERAWRLVFVVAVGRHPPADRPRRPDPAGADRAQIAGFGPAHLLASSVRNGPAHHPLAPGEPGAGYARRSSACVVPRSSSTGSPALGQPGPGPSSSGASACGLGDAGLGAVKTRSFGPRPVRRAGRTRYDDAVKLVNMTTS